MKLTKLTPKIVLRLVGNLSEISLLLGISCGLWLRRGPYLVRCRAKKFCAMTLADSDFPAKNYDAIPECWLGG